MVKELTAHLQGKYHHTYFDNFSTSQQFLVDLEKDGIYACGRARKDSRGFPVELKTAKLTIRYVWVSVSKWKDVCMGECYKCLYAMYMSGCIHTLYVVHVNVWLLVTRMKLKLT